MTIKTIANAVQDAIGLPRSTAVISSTDPNVRALVAVANQEGRELARRHNWQAITKEKTITAAATEEQTSGIPTDFDRFINGSMYNRTKTRGVAGPLSAVEWQSQKALNVTVLTDAFRQRGNALLFTPTPTANDVYAYEYVSTQWCQSSGSTAQSAWAADTDTGVLSEDLMELGIVWRLLKNRGLDYAEAFNTYEREVIQAIMRDGGKRTRNYDNGNDFFRGTAIVPEGSWAL